MYRSFTIKNFRCFRDLKLAPLERVNLIAGMNNVGKTALLEALFIHAGPNNPELPLRVNAFRDIEHFAVDAEEMWGWLFFNKHLDEAIELESLNENNERSSLRIRLAESEASTLGLPGDNDTASSSKLVRSLTTMVGSHDLILEYQGVEGQTKSSRASITSDGKIKIERAQLRFFPSATFLSSGLRFPKEDAERFSNLERVGRQDEVIDTLKILEPRLHRLAVLVTGGTPMISGDIGIGELVPLPLMGEGMARLLSIVLAIANVPRGAILIDEIENGLYHSVMVNVWKAIALAARRSEAQIFAATHSWECIQAAHEAFVSTGTYDFRLHRLDRVNEEIQAITYDRETLSAALKSELEVR